MKTLLQLFAAFLKIGAFTIGGGLAMLPLIQREMVEVRKWLTEEEMLDCIAVCQSLPGAVAINAATYVGKMKKGLPGSIFASVGVILPSFTIIILAVLLLGAIGENIYVAGALEGIKAASCALILYAAFTLGRQTLRGKFAWVIAVLSFAAIAFFKVTAVWAILAGAAAGIVYAKCGRAVK